MIKLINLMADPERFERQSPVTTDWRKRSKHGNLFNTVQNNGDLFKEPQI